MGSLKTLVPYNIIFGNMLFQLLYHTEDKHIDTRKADYTVEAKEYYHGNIFVPDDLDVIEI